MKSYKCHKAVKAAKITGVRNDTHGTGYISTLILDDGEHFHVRPGWAEQKGVVIGGYLVVYEDGYSSFSPAEAFEKGYTVNREPMLSLDQAKDVVSTKTAPRVTEEAILAAIREVDYLKHGVLCICIITMKNGFKVTGKAAPADERNFDYQVGQRFAYNDAFKQLWPLMGFALCESLHADKAFFDAFKEARPALLGSDRPDPRGDEPRKMEPQAEEWRGHVATQPGTVLDAGEADTTDTTSGADEPDHAA